MWMQLLNAAGLPPIGSAFPRDWEETLKDANPAGFWESELRKGIYFATNPDPKTGVYLFPEDTRRHAVKVFIPGLIRTDRAFIDGVIATVRPWRQYARSLHRLYAIEREAKHKAQAERGEENEIPDAIFLPPVIEWWMENYSLISDIITRRYPFYMVAYDSVLEEPERVLRGVFEWLKFGDVEAAIAQVEPSLRTQDEAVDDLAVEEEGQFEPEAIEVFDQLYEVVRTQEPLTQAFVDRLNETNERLSERIQTAVKETTQAQLERRRLIQTKLQERRSDSEASAGSDSAK